MHLKFLRAAATVAVLGGTATLGLGSTQAALATSPTIVDVPCNSSDLVLDMYDALSVDNTVLYLARDCTYWLHGPATSMSPSFTYTTGLPTVMNELTIVGSHSTWIKRSYEGGTPAFTIFAVGCANGDLTLEGVNVKNGGGGSEDGGALHVSNGSATVEGGIFEDNNVSDTAYGGAIYNDSTLTVDDGATFTDNSANYGGAIYNDGTMTVDDAAFTHNTAIDGGAIDNSGSSLTVSGSTFRENYASDEDYYGGGAIYSDENMTVDGGHFTRNSAYLGGGAIYDEYEMTVNGGTYSQNEAEYGGAFYNGDDTLTISDSSITHNRAYQGGGIYNDAETVYMNNSIVFFNTATDDGGGIYNYGDGTVDLTVSLINWNHVHNCYPVDSITGCFG